MTMQICDEPILGCTSVIMICYANLDDGSCITNVASEYILEYCL